jgi:uncharacterized membrane protein
MADKKLVEYMKQNIEKGHSIEEIKSFVAQSGWDQKQIEEAVQELTGAAPEPVRPHPPPAEPKPAAPQVARPSGPESVLPPEETRKPDAGKPEPAEPAKKKGRKTVLIIAIIILIILIVFFIYSAADILKYFNDLFPETLLPG